jgi:glycosyltransferase involved in cell wall biosynthesis
MLAESLAASGHKVHLLVFNDGEDVEMKGVLLDRVRSFPGTSGIGPGFSLKKLISDQLMLCKASRLIRKGDFDLVHAVEESAFIALALQKFYGVPYLYDMDSSLALQMEDKFSFLGPVCSILRSAENGAIRKSIGVVAVCKSLEKIARDADADKPILRLEDVSMLPRNIEIKEDIRKEQKISGPIFMYVGNLESYQGIDLMLESFALASTGRNDTALVIIGGKETAIRKYRGKAEQLRINTKTFFLGTRPISELGSCLIQADILLSPRISGNNTPMKIYSYLDSGKPVLATRLTTHTQVLDNRISLLAGPTPKEFGAAMVQLLEKPELRKQLAEQAKERVRQDFSREAFKRKLLSFYNEIEKIIPLTKG